MVSTLLLGYNKTMINFHKGIRNYVWQSCAWFQGLGFRLNQHKAIVQLGHLIHFYKRALEKNITGVHFETK